MLITALEGETKAEVEEDGLMRFIYFWHNDGGDWKCR